MNRRTFLGTSTLAAVPATAAGVESSHQYVALTFYDLHNSSDNQSKRLKDFLEQAHLPAAKRVGISSVGYFQVYLGPEMPRLVSLCAYASLADVEAKRAVMRKDKEWMSAVKQVSASSAIFDRKQVWLLRTFDAHPRVEAPQIVAGKKPRFFDLRTYESESLHKGNLKVEMFNSGEIDIFRATGLNPVFFGQTLFGAKMPNLTYMVWYDDWDAREAAWTKFRNHPDWKKMSSDPRWKGTVSNITNTFLQPLKFSPIR